MTPVVPVWQNYANSTVLHNDAWVVWLPVKITTTENSVDRIWCPKLPG